jgi:2-hydroxy-3-keto-5-methylthiopentenyl-1-phosphate phosphatase
VVVADNKTIVQCDFDGTVTKDDASFLILDAFGHKDWRRLFEDYQQNKMTLGRFNAEAFSTVTADEKSLLEITRKARVRPGLRELAESCRRRDFRLVIVSNGLRFYIEDILRSSGVDGIDVHAAETEFTSRGLKVYHIGPDGTVVDNGVKLAYANSFLAQGNRLVYIGDGTSDIAPARRSHHIFAIDSLLKHCESAGVECVPFFDLRQVAGAIEAM